jgi:hypothetical protein
VPMLVGWFGLKAGGNHDPADSRLDSHSFGSGSTRLAA